MKKKIGRNERSSRVDPRRALGLLGLLAIAVAAFLLGLHRASRVRNWAGERREEAKAGRSVDVVVVRRSSGEREVTVIGETRPFLSVILYGRVSGYLRDLRVDKGDYLKKGEIAAVIEAPETDKAYFAALADLRNKGRIADRAKILLARQLISQQEADQAFAAADIARQTLETQRVLRSYEVVHAPFDGRVTSRFVDPGALIQNASSSQSASQPLVTISTVDRLRVFAYLDQKDAAFVHAGALAQISLPERPELRFDEKVARVAGELDPKTRTMLTEVDMDNTLMKIVPGSFVRVTVRVPEEPALSIPVEALVSQGDRTIVPVVGRGDEVQYREIEVAGNDGKRVRVVSGLREGERVALNLGVSVVPGSRVKPVLAGEGAEREARAGQAGRGAR